MRWCIRTASTVRESIVRMIRKRLRPGSNQMTLEWKAVILRDPCVYCGRAGGELEHIQARCHGGGNGWPNIASACKACNTMKASGSIWWMLWRLNEQRLGFVDERVIARRVSRGRGRRGELVVATMLFYPRMLERPKAKRKRWVAEARTDAAVRLSWASPVVATRD